MAIYDRLLKFVSIRPRSEQEVKNWFARKKVDEETQKDLLARLRQLNLVDDKDFAKWWVEQRTAFRPKGKRALAYELKSKGVTDEIIGEVLEASNLDEVGLASKLLDNYSYKWQKLTRKEARTKKSQFLAQRGFGWEAAKSAIDSIAPKE